ncbi:hypothetical protein H6F32_15645 [Anabaena sp. FACHB-1237]|uniref:hypothetical protein n=1 Tax=Anabaena sp. FACHB-1237 TaxID=2692769 RepID=UPI00168109BA|nr:hypothetical protein [Anabaena sp. FACHB-1237]MBD2138971.1 hypothetical protein [Anabaena sp. FACHB-1237]
MERGLFWLPLLFAFFWLAWQGYQEYQKVEIYRLWGKQFTRAKYDIYAVIGQKDNDITWGKPTAKGIINLQTFSLLDVQEIQLLVNNNSVDMENITTKNVNVKLQFLLKNNESVEIPFTQVTLAAEWGKCLQGIITRNH